MTEIIFSFPARNRAPLSCVWVETGNPARPLARKWIAGRQITTNQPENFAAEARSSLLCA